MTRPRRQPFGASSTSHSGKQQQSTGYITVSEEDQEQEVHSQSALDPKDQSLYAVGGSTAPPYQVSLIINNVSHTMELDTGASITLMSEAECHQLYPRSVLRDSSVLLRTYSGKRIHMVEKMDVCVQYEHQVQYLVLTVVAGDGLSLLGRNWLQNIRQN